MAAKRRARRKGNGLIWVVLIVGIGGIAAYLYWKQKQATAGAASSSALASSTAVQGIAPVSEPNSFASTPTIQNFVSNTTAMSSSLFAPVTSFHVKPLHLPHVPLVPPHHPMTRPNRR